MECPSWPKDPDASPRLPSVVSGDCVANLLKEGHSVRVRVHGNSMAPSIRDGSLLTLVPVAQAPLHLGDVGFYRSPGGRLVCHRLLASRHIKGINYLGFRGDAYTSALAWIEAKEAIGKVIELEGRRLTSPLGRWPGLVRAWGRWALARAGIQLGAWRRHIISNPDGR